jgi:hypothetical protein
VVALEQLTPALEKTAAAADCLLFAKYSDTVLRHLGIDDQVLRAVRTIVDKAQLKAFETLLPEDQGEVLQYLTEGFGPDEVFVDVVNNAFLGVLRVPDVVSPPLPCPQR